MRLITLTGLFATLAAVSAGTVKSPTQVVPLIGPSFLSNFDPTTSYAINNATEAFPSIIESLFDSGALNKTDLVFSIDVFSAATNASLFSYHHVGEGQEQVLTAGELDDQTIGRAGSVTKLFTVYALLVKAGIEVFDKPVTDYLPELRRTPSANEDHLHDLSEHIRWEEITIGALASHQAGSGGAGSLLLEHADEAIPIITPEGKQKTTFESSTDSLHTNPFFHADLLTHMRDVKRPVTSPYRNALYSDGGFALLGEVLARISGQSYGDAIQSILCEPLGMEHISVTAPKGEGVNAINRTAITNNTSWGLDLPIVAG
jgi:CubicO group peptidase (beta-lactamase class C family)